MILNLIFVPIAVLAAIGVLLGAKIALWWLPLLLIGGYLATVVVYFLILSIASLLMPKKAPARCNPLCRWLIAHTMHWLMPFAAIRVVLLGAEKIPDCPCVFVSNHRSDFDPLTLLAALRHRKLVYISKQENFKIPVVGPFMRCGGFISLDRGNGLRAVKTLQTAAEHMKSDAIDIGIYPEGTRSRTGKLLRFKPGACYLAQQAEAPIVVLTTQGTERISKRFFLKPLRVELKVVEVIDVDRVMRADQNDLTAELQQIVASNLPNETSAEA
ncbi:MAG: hypothetical protein E7620_09530 [Ruminococcaceae bacterium]|nr:hypothetical protein [Oscillospiraceae bacterium]